MIRRLLIAAAVVVASVAALVLTGATAPSGQGKSYWVVFDNVFGLTAGGDLKVGGVKAGETTDFRLTDDEPRKVAVRIELTEPGLTALRRDASCAVRQQSLIGEYFVDCQPGTGKLLPEGGTVPVEQTSSTIPIDLVSNVMRMPYRERFRLIISELGVGLAGRPDDLSEVIRRAHPGLRETSRTFAILAAQNREIADFIERSDAVAREVAPQRRQLSRWAQEASETATVQASREQSLAAQWNRLPVFLSELQPTLAQLQATASRQIPVLEQLRRTAPELERFLAELEPFADAAVDANVELGRTARAGRAALEESAEEVATLRDLAPDAPRLGRPLRQFLEALDDRSRSTEDDPLLAELAPPEPDKTAYRRGRGLTGMEAFWNYIYGQTLATNVYDEIGHLLRIVVLRDTRCSPYSAAPSKDDIARCGSFLGPYQPGLEEAKGKVGRFEFGPADRDPTDERLPSAAARHGADRGARAARSGDERPGSARDAAEPRALPADAQDEPSARELPGLSLVEDLAGRLLPGGRPGPGNGSGERPDQEPGRGSGGGPGGRDPVDPMLDFLLGP